MKVPVSWLRELVELDATVSEIADALARGGLAVESITRTGKGVSGVKVARVLEVAPVPESKKLCVAQLDAGELGSHQIVAGARNFAAGDLVAYAMPGSRVTTLDAPLGVRKMAGRYDSFGMLCSARELGISDDHGGILILDAGAPVGADAAQWLGLDDEVIEFDVTANRPDHMSVLGVAREAAALMGGRLTEPSYDVSEDGSPATDHTSVRILDDQACPAYLARVVTGATWGSSPARAQVRLTACGMRPLGNLVDATNYVLLLTGQPLHAFDLDRLDERRIVVRRAASGEKIRTLDGVVRDLEPGDLVIADAAQPQAIAGVMGGADAEVSEFTSRILLESAYFDASTVSATMRRMGLLTEAARRFERGTDYAMVSKAQSLCAALLGRWAGGTVAPGVAGTMAPAEPRRIPLRESRVQRVLGVAVPGHEMKRILESLGARVHTGGDAASVEPPSWRSSPSRPDLEREVDLIEEIARVYGYDRIPMRLPTGARGGLTRAQRLRRRVREVLTGAGLTEATSSSFLSRRDLDPVGPLEVVEVDNPLSAELEILRPSLLPGLLAAAGRNVAQRVTDVALFEIGTAFAGWPAGAELPDERLRLAFVICGRLPEAAWHSSPRMVDFYDAKGIVELLAAELGITGWSLEPVDRMPLHPGRSALLMIAGGEAGVFGELRPSVCSSFDLAAGAVAAELDLKALIEAAARTLQVRDLPRHAAATRDLSIVVDERVAAGDVARVLRDGAGDTAEAVQLLGVYRGDPIEPGRKNLVWRLVLRSAQSALSGGEADDLRRLAAEAVRAAFGAEIR